jgi:ubiquinone/menaquinone biosynthesis C-methylase UbiE
MPPRTPRQPGQPGSKPPARKPQPRQAASSDWGHVAQWYDQLVGDQGSDYQRHVVFPGLLAMLDPKQREKVLDIACGQGVLCRILHQHGCQVTGVDAAAELIDRAKNRSHPGIDYRVGDAEQLEKIGLAEASFDAAVCVLAIQNIPHIQPVFQGASHLLKHGGRFVIVMMHPAFRGPKIAGWQWDDATQTQRRWSSHYLTPRKERIITHPGKATGEHTWTYHRPIQDYVRALAGAGLLVRDLQEWPSHKSSDSGPRAAAENISRQEIPMFLAVEAVKP